MRRLTVAVILLLLLLPAASSAQIRGPFSFADAMMSKGRIASAGRPKPQASLSIPREPLRLSPEFGQRSISKDYEFTLYLIENNMHKDALALMCSSLFQPSDTLSYLRGWTFYHSGYLADAASQFSQVQQNSAFYDKSLFYNVAMNAHLGNYGRCTTLLNSYAGQCSDIQALQQAGASLLQRDFNAYHEAATSIGNSHYAIVEAAADLAITAAAMETFKPKSPFLGAAASALLPGLGKFYSGRVGEGVSAFITVCSLGAITAENWIKCGPEDWKTIVFGTLGTIFYLGNIYGSFVSVKLYNSEMIQKHETAILVDMHIPLHSIFR